MIWKPTENGTGGGAGGIRSAAAAAYSCTFSASRLTAALTTGSELGRLDSAQSAGVS